MMTPEQIKQFLTHSDPDTVVQHILDQYEELFRGFTPLLQEADRHIWQPIETIPETDERNTVDLWVPGLGRVPNAYMNADRIFYDKLSRRNDSTLFIMNHMLEANATHWRHRPRAPEGMKEENPTWL